MLFGSSGCLNCSCSCLEVGLALSWLSEQISDLDSDCFPLTAEAADFFLISPGVTLL